METSYYIAMVARGMETIVTIATVARVMETIVSIYIDSSSGYG